MTDRLRILVLCTGNSARSQMAEALFRSLSKGRIDVYSAGTVPQPCVHPMATVTMREKFGLDISNQFPKTVDRYLAEPFDYVITVCDNAAETCPTFPGRTERIHWSFPDPAAAVGSEGERQRAFDLTAADIAGRIRVWLHLPAIARRIGDPAT
jgi:arsenate reductase